MPVGRRTRAVAGPPATPKGIPLGGLRWDAGRMADQETAQTDECPRCQKRTLLRAVADEVRAAFAGEPERHEHWEFVVCPVCGWNNLPERYDKQH